DSELSINIQLLVGSTQKLKRQFYSLLKLMNVR
ncbi:MAG: hypothetical protein RIS10_1278, partial [Pseudomonadota bacterium]